MIETDLAANTLIQTILDTSTDSILIFDKYYKIVLFNQSASKLFNNDDMQDWLKEQSLRTIIPDIDIIFSSLSFPVKPVSLYETKVLTQHKILVPAQVSLSGFSFSQAEGIVCIIKEIKTLENLESQLKKAQAEVIAANTIKSEFVANMSHEMRTPLTTIVGYSEILQEEAEDAGLDNYKANLKKIIESAKHLMTFIDDLLDLSKIESGKLDLFLEDIKVHDIIYELKPFCEPLMKKNNNNFNIILPEENNIIHADRIRLRQALLMLLDNASKFTENGQITLEIKPLLQSNREIMLQFSVTDTGIGMSSAQLEKLFWLFSHADAHTARKYGSTHLGLYLTKRVCELLGGCITIESKENKGSTFSIILPRKSVSGNDEMPSLIPPDSDASPLEGKTVLIIDHDPKLHRETQQALGKSGFNILHAFKGEEGLKLARLNKPHIIILDVTDVITLDMTASLMDGWSTLSALKSDAKLALIPVLVLTSTAKTNLSLSMGAADYLAKPVKMNMLAEKIIHLLSLENTKRGHV